MFQITFDPNLEHIPFETLMVNHTKEIKPGIQLGKENGLSILLDAEVRFFKYLGVIHKWRHANLDYFDNPSPHRLAFHY
jgi:hypothetical protein